MRLVPFLCCFIFLLIACRGDDNAGESPTSSFATLQVKVELCDRNINPDCINTIDTPYIGVANATVDLFLSQEDLDLGINPAFTQKTDASGYTTFGTLENGFHFGRVITPYGNRIFESVTPPGSFGNEVFTFYTN